MAVEHEHIQPVQCLPMHVFIRFYFKAIAVAVAFRHRCERTEALGAEPDIFQRCPIDRDRGRMIGFRRRVLTYILPILLCNLDVDIHNLSVTENCPVYLLLVTQYP